MSGTVTQSTSQSFQKANKVESYKEGDEARTRWGHWKITKVVYADPDTKTTPIRCEKDILVEPGESLSSQAHYGRGELYEGISGTTMVCVEDKIFPLKEGDTVDIPRGALHFSWNDGPDDAVFYEVQEGPLCAESDIKRGADRRKLNRPHLLNSSAEDEGKSPEQVLLDQRMAVAKNRLKTEGVKKSYSDNDFMPKVVKLLETYPQGFSDANFLSELKSQFSKDIHEHLKLHEHHTPKLKPEVEKAIKAELKIA
tara:strand:- start:555 stop:1316 length:762 start_codon:yes stop_codon:yes gene_type:complete